MYTDYFFTEDTTILISVFGLAWFLIGVAIGSRLRPRSLLTASREGGGGESVELYVGNLSYDVTRKDIVNAFGQHGNVGSVRIIKNRMNGKSKGYGFVQMQGRPDAKAAIKGMNGADMQGRKLVVNEARSSARSRDQ
ncbi:MAG: RNA-binding protein [Lentisphaerae bacterium]|nr:RNA-binding protein [Lentisphaerota bacterium]